MEVLLTFGQDFENDIIDCTKNISKNDPSSPDKIENKVISNNLLDKTNHNSNVISNQSDMLLIKPTNEIQKIILNPEIDEP